MQHRKSTKSILSTVHSKSESNLRILTVKEQFLLSPTSCLSKYSRDPFFRYQLSYLNQLTKNSLKNKENISPFQQQIIEKAKREKYQPILNLKAYQIRKEIQSEEVLKLYRDFIAARIFTY